MFKILYRTLIILAAAVLVSYGLYWFGQTSFGQGLFSGVGGEHGHGERFAPGQGEGARPARGNFGGKGAFEGGREGGVNIARGLADIPSKIGVIALITVAVLLARKFFASISRAVRKRQPERAIPT